MAAAPDPRLEIVVGDITALSVDVVVNAANERLKRGGGVDGAIHRAAGPDLQEHLDTHLAGCATGHCVASPAFGLSARHIVHCVGPVWHGGGSGEEAKLASCYRRALEIAADLKARTIAFPAIRTGVYGFPPDSAARIAVATVRQGLEDIDTIQKVFFVCFNEDAATSFRRVFASDHLPS